MTINYAMVKAAVRKGGSVRGAARVLKMSHTALQRWLLVNRYVVVKEARLRKSKR